MNRRRLLQLLLAGAIPVGFVAPGPHQAAAQRSPGPSKQKPRRPRARRGSPQREGISAELERVLQQWETASAKFQKLKGRHQRFVYDSVFQVEKRAVGTFWFEAPDKGRIDIEPDTSVEPGTVNPDKIGENGKPFTVQRDKETHWISTGKEILQVDVEKKTVNVFPIPEQVRGEKIVDSPLPFLFGMEADKAKKRYRLAFGRFHDPKSGRIHIIAHPRLMKDAANWSRAEVLLDARTFYPKGIRLIDPSENRETVYAFEDVHEPNFFENLRNPFRWGKPGFKVVRHSPKSSGARMPSLLGLHWKKTKKLLEKAGFTVKLRQGRPAPKKELVYHIYRQSPRPNEPFDREKPIVLTLYDKPSGGEDDGREDRTSARPTVPRKR